MKYSAQHPAIPIIMYDPHQPPIVPNCTIGLPDEVLQHKGQIAVAIINESGSKAMTNPVRMYCYNALAENCFNNQFFEEVFNFTIGLVGLNMKKQSHLPAMQHIKNATEHALTLICGVLIHREPELKSLIPSRLIEAANQNIPFYSNLQQEINRVFPNTPNPTFGMNAPNMNIQVFIMNSPQGSILAIQFPNGQTQQLPISNYNGQFYIQFNGQSFQIANTPQGVMILLNGQWMPGANLFGQYAQQPTQQSMYPQQPMQQPMYPQQPNQFNTGAFNQSPMQQDTHRFSSNTFAKPADPTFSDVIKQNGQSDHRYVDVNVQTIQKAPEPVQVSAQTKNERFKTLQVKGKVMGSAKINILGNTFSLDGVVRQQAVRDALTTMSSVTSIVDENCTVVHSKRIYTCDIEEAFRNGKISQLSHDNNNTALYRVFGCTMNPIITKYKELSEFVDKLRKSLTITELATRLRSMSTALSSDQFDKMTASDIAVILSYIDQLLTKITNKFLSLNMFIEGKEIGIDSFIEDVTGLPNYIQRTRGQTHLAVFENFEKTLLDNFSSIDKTAEQEIIYGLNLPENLLAVCVPTSFSITYTNLTNEEFNFDLKKEPVFVDRQIAPELYKICQTLNLHKKSMDAYTQYDYLETSDGVRYRLYSIMTALDQYLIEKC